MFRLDVQLQEISQNLKTIIDNIDEGIHVIDGDGRLVFINDVARNLFHREGPDPGGRHITEVFAGSPSRSEALLEAVRTGRVVAEREETLTRDDGGILTVESINVPVKLGSRIIGAVKVSRNDAVVAELTRRIVDLQTRLHECKAAGTSRIAEAANEAAKSPAGSSPVGVRVEAGAIVGVSEPISRLKHILQEIAAVDEPVLIYGEPGVGHELAASVIHAQSNPARRRGPFVCQSMRAVPDSMVEELLFGISSLRGLISLADGGTLFLRDVDAMPRDLLARLVTVVRERQVFRAKGTGLEGVLERVDVRFIFGASTVGKAIPSTLASMVGSISTLPIFIPPLRDRKEDIPHLMAHFISEFNNRFGKHCVGTSDAVNAVFQRYNWPGNVRELKCAIEQAMILSEDDSIRLEHLPPNLQHIAGELGFSLPETGHISVPKSRLLGSNRPAHALRPVLENLEIEMVNDAMKKAGGNISRAARLLGIPRQTLQYRLKKHNIRGNEGDKTG